VADLNFSARNEKALWRASRRFLFRGFGSAHLETVNAEGASRVPGRSGAGPRTAIINRAVMVVGAPAPTSLPVFGGRA